MIKYFCDHCKAEIWRKENCNILRLELSQYEFCDDCLEMFFVWVDNKPTKKDILKKMLISEKENQCVFLRYWTNNGNTRYVCSNCESEFGMI